jgi:hypothetical protein
MDGLQLAGERYCLREHGMEVDILFRRGSVAICVRNANAPSDVPNMP